ncbi:hypothetical protein BH18ACT13_BH18ACT13_14920 [soil metagenome]
MNLYCRRPRARGARIGIHRHAAGMARCRDRVGIPAAEDLLPCRTGVRQRVRLTCVQWRRPTCPRPRPAPGSRQARQAQEVRRSREVREDREDRRDREARAGQPRPENLRSQVGPRRQVGRAARQVLGRRVGRQSRGAQEAQRSPEARQARAGRSVLRRQAGLVSPVCLWPRVCPWPRVCQRLLARRWVLADRRVPARPELRSHLVRPQPPASPPDPGLRDALSGRGDSRSHTAERQALADSSLSPWILRSTLVVSPRSTAPLGRLQTSHRVVLSHPDIY